MSKKNRPTPKAPQNQAPQGEVCQETLNDLSKMTEVQNIAKETLFFLDDHITSLSEAAMVLDIMGKMLQGRIKILMDGAPVLSPADKEQRNNG